MSDSYEFLGLMNLSANGSNADSWPIEEGEIETDNLDGTVYVTLTRSGQRVGPMAVLVTWGGTSYGAQGGFEKGVQCLILKLDSAGKNLRCLPSTYNDVEPAPGAVVGHWGVSSKSGGCVKLLEGGKAHIGGTAAPSDEDAVIRKSDLTALITEFNAFRLAMVGLGYAPGATPFVGPTGATKARAT